MIKISDLAEYDKKMTIGELIKQIKNEYKYICPKCKGSGKIYHIPDENFDLAGPHPEPGYIECSLCNGYGRTKEKYEPLIKIVDYVKAPNKGE